MKFISLNIWDARVFEPLMDFFGHNQEIDIFCLQEVFNGNEIGFFRDRKRINGFLEIQNKLPNHQGYFVNTELLDDIPERGIKVPYGLAIFMKKDIKVLSHHHDIIFGDAHRSLDHDAKTHKRVIQTVCINENNRPIAISNVHGLWNGQGKTDTPDRIEQSNKIKTHIKKFNYPIILAGDFNLLPDTQSLGIIREGMRDLIKEYNITSTRSKLYNKHEKPVLYADYIFTSSEIEINDFNILSDVVSDHLPLLLDFN